MELISGARHWWRLWSIRLGIASHGLLIVMWSWPESMLIIWNMMPPEVRAILPPRFTLVLPIVLGVASLGARLVKQPAIAAKQEEAWQGEWGTDASASAPNQ
jgi:hypothetical protein